MSYRHVGFVPVLVYSIISFRTYVDIFGIEFSSLLHGTDKKKKSGKSLKLFEV